MHFSQQFLEADTIDFPAHISRFSSSNIQDFAVTNVFVQGCTTCWQSFVNLCTKSFIHTTLFCSDCPTQSSTSFASSFGVTFFRDGNKSDVIHLVHQQWMLCCNLSVPLPSIDLMIKHTVLDWFTPLEGAGVLPNIGPMWHASSLHTAACAHSLHAVK